MKSKFINSSSQIETQKLEASDAARNNTKYVLVKINGNNHQIGRIEYDDEESAISRQNELLNVGLNLNVMTLEQAYGV